MLYSKVYKIIEYVLSHYTQILHLAEYIFCGAAGITIYINQ